MHMGIYLTIGSLVSAWFEFVTSYGAEIHTYVYSRVKETIALNSVTRRIYIFIRANFFTSTLPYSLWNVKWQSKTYFLQSVTAKSNLYQMVAQTFRIFCLSFDLSLNCYRLDGNSECSIYLHIVRRKYAFYDVFSLVLERDIFRVRNGYGARISKIFLDHLLILEKAFNDSPSLPRSRL